MWKNYKVKIHNLKKEQIKYIYDISDAYRYCYNWGINFHKTYYENEGKSPSFIEMCSAFTEFRNSKEHIWLQKYDVNTCRLALRDVKNAYIYFFRGETKYPKFKSRKKNRIFFRVRGDRINFFGPNNRFIVIPGFSKMDPNGDRFSDLRLVDCKRHNIPVGKNINYKNVSITRNGISYWLNLSIEFPDIVIDENDLPHENPIGIDVGVVTTAYLSNGIKFDRPNPKRLAILEHRRRKLQSIISNDINKRLSESKRTKTKYVDIPKSKNQMKREEKLRKTYFDIHNIYDNHYHQVSRAIANMKPSFVAIEDLSIRKLSKDRPYSKKHIIPARLGLLLHDITYKCENQGTTVIRVPMTFPSSQLCSCCGHRQNMKNKRIFKCEICGNVLDRDYNASLNLLHYGEGAI